MYYYTSMLVLCQVPILQTGKFLLYLCTNMSTEQTPERDFLFLRGHSIPPIGDAAGLKESTLATRKWVHSLTPEQKRNYRALRKTVYQLLGLPPKFGLGLRDYIESIRNDNSQKEALGIRSCMLTAGMYGITGSQDSIITRISEHAEKANNLIYHANRNILTDPFVTFEMANEVAAADNPSDLLLIAYSEKYPEKTRFEAIRKLGLMRLSLGNERKRFDNKPREQFNRVLDFLDQHVWSKKRKISQTTTKYILSTHDMTDYGCTDVQILDTLPAQLQPNQRITPMNRRAFTMVRNHGKEGKDIEAYMPMREKDDVSQMLKEIRKKSESPYESIEDEVAAMIIVSDPRHLDYFDQRLTQGATEAGSLVMNEDMSNSMDNGHYADGNPGSSPELRMLKSPIRVVGARAEIMALLLTDYIDYLYKDGIAHPEYEVNRFFESGSAELAFPPQIFKYDPNQSHERIVQALRRKKRVEMSWYDLHQTQTPEEKPLDNQTLPQTSLITRVTDRVVHGWRIIRGLRAS